MSQPTDQTRAELYARSALYAQDVLRNSKLRDTFARQGRFLAGDQWDALLARAAEPNAAAEPEAPAPKGKGRKAKGI